MKHKLESYTIEENAEDNYPITCNVRDLRTDELINVSCKFLIGADGGRSPVRRMANIPFDGERTSIQWIRMDAVVETDMPNSRELNSLDSKSHGQILFCPIDKWSNSHRLGLQSELVGSVWCGWGNR